MPYVILKNFWRLSEIRIRITMCWKQRRWKRWSQTSKLLFLKITSYKNTYYGTCEMKTKTQKQMHIIFFIRMVVIAQEKNPPKHRHIKNMCAKSATHTMRAYWKHKCKVKDTVDTSHWKINTTKWSATENVFNLYITHIIEHLHITILKLIK